MMGLSDPEVFTLIIPLQWVPGLKEIESKSKLAFLDIRAVFGFLSGLAVPNPSESARNEFYAKF